MNERNILSEMRKTYYKHKISDMNEDKKIKDKGIFVNFVLVNNVKLYKYQNHKLSDPHFNLQ